METGSLADMHWLAPGAPGEAGVRLQRGWAWPVTSVSRTGGDVWTDELERMCQRETVACSGSGGPVRVQWVQDP